MQSHPNAIGLYGKSFPHFDTLDTVFGKDKASGNVAEDTADMAAEIEKEYFPSTQGGGSGINLIDDEDDFESQIPETPIANTTTPGSNPTNQSQRDSTNYRTGKRGGKRVKHNDDGSDSLLTSVNKLGEFYASGVDNMKQLSSCFMHEKITAERRNEIVSILNELELPDDDVVMAAVLITKDNNLCDCFFAMNTSELRKKFVGMLLRTNGFQQAFGIFTISYFALKKTYVGFVFDDFIVELFLLLFSKKRMYGLSWSFLFIEVLIMFNYFWLQETKVSAGFELYSQVDNKLGFIVFVYFYW